MKIESNTAKLRHHALRAIIAAALTVASATHVEPARATGFPVIDIAAITNALQNYGEQIARWGETVKHYTDVMDHYAAQAAFWQQQLNKLRALDLDLFTIEQDFKVVDADYGVEEMCPGASPTSIVDSVTSALASAINPDGDVVGEQQKICVKMVRTKNRKYNDTVAYLGSLRMDTDNFLQITAKRLAELGNSPGNTQGLTLETQRYSSNMQLAKDKWQTAMAQYDIQLGLLAQQQTVLSKRAMSGKPSIWGTLVNTAALQGALSINK
ncbi:hypothetical protein C8J98_104308 [Luteibacter sp. OK325]|nr:hypothetical protein C8J98_104308 [Luteibacter sp. OK325]